MLKRKLIRAGLFGNGLVIVLVSVNGTHSKPAAPAKLILSLNPLVRQLEAFDSSFADASTLQGNAFNQIPRVQLNKHAAKYVADYPKDNLESLEKIRERGEQYFPMMDSIFSHYRLPIELKYLAAVESELKYSAVSRVGATGPWQLMTGTARDLSLKIRGSYDERKNYNKSTVAAAKYLRDLYNEFGDWLLVIAAYNSGPGKVINAIKTSGSHNFWALQTYLPAETKGHVKRYIAMHYYFENSGSITTLTKAETIKYKQLISQYLADQKAESQLNNVVAIASTKTKHLGASK